MSLLWVLHAIVQEIAPLHHVVLVKLQELSAPPCATVVEGRIRNVLYLMTYVAQGPTTVTVKKSNIFYVLIIPDKIHYINTLINYLNRNFDFNCS